MMMIEEEINGRPTWAEIDLDALAHNFHLIRDRVGKEVKILAAVKADAYGHGAVECARRLAAEGALLCFNVKSSETKSVEQCLNT